MARNLRRAQIGVERLKDEIRENINAIISGGCMTPRAMRQISDGDRFLKMITNFPYTRARTVGQLKKEISAQRNTLKAARANLDPYLPGYQFSFDDLDREKEPEYVEKLLEEEAKRIDAEIRWLQKALGICSNLDYFK